MVTLSGKRSHDSVLGQSRSINTLGVTAMKDERLDEVTMAPRQEESMRQGTTLIEIGVAVGIFGLMAGLTFPKFGSYRDRVAVDAAASSTQSLLATARHAALRRATRTAVHLDTASATVFIVAGIDTLERRPLRDVHGVVFSTTRDSIAFTSGGLGYGAANTQIILRRGMAADTIAVSRLGRARR
jgi:Tfp pilus assembly protein FimT